jgi:hypothetical protein
MIKRTVAGIALLVTLLFPGMASAQPSPDALATARELMVMSRANENLKLLLPTIAQHMKSAIVQGRPQVEKDYDALVPMLLGSFNARLGELIDQIAVIYATNFTVAEMKELIEFYRGPVGQKFLSKGPVIAQQSMTAGQQFGAQIGRELQSRIVEELKKKGHNI